MNEDQARELRLKALLSTPALLTAGHGFHLFDIEVSRTAPFPPPWPANLVFGKKMERLFSHYLQYSKRYSLLAEGLQIVENKTTVGELDFIVKDKIRDEVIHIEMACKFYLYRPGLSTHPMECWIGPNGRDRLVDKLYKLRTKQFPLLHHPLVKKALTKLGISTKNIVQQVFMPGQLFTPKNLNGPNPQLNPKAITGYWLGKNEFEQTDFSKAELHIPTKENWLLHPKHATDWKPAAIAVKEVIQKLHNRQSPLMWIKTEEHKYQRFFVLWW